MAQTILDLLKKGIEANHADKFRQGNLVSLPPTGMMIVTGDIHGHRRNFERILTYADLENNPQRHLLLQEIIHGGPENEYGECLSYTVLLDAVRYKIKFPDRVHIIMGNHDTAFITDAEVMKNGKEMNRSMCSAIDRQFGADSQQIKQAMKHFLFSQPLAVRCANRIWLSHSLPSNTRAEQFDKTIMDRPLEPSDLVRPGSAYLLTWGRNHDQLLLDTMAELLDVDFFILGHQPQPNGWRVAGMNLIILACEHNHGCLLRFNMANNYTIEELMEKTLPLSSIA
jgi:predicted phosphodiesterase